MESIKERLIRCIFRRGTPSMSPEIRGGHCQVTKASPGRENVTSEGRELSCVKILYGARWKMRQTRRLERKIGLRQTVGCMRGLLRVSVGFLWQTHLSAQTFQQGIEEGVKGLGQEDPDHTSSFLLESVLFLKFKSYQLVWRLPRHHPGQSAPDTRVGTLSKAG